jgi:tetratricopeptide (TPR) repeat protein
MAQPNTLLHALLLWAFILISSAHASSDSELCSTAKTPDLAISYCTHAIKAGGLGNDGLAIVYSNRGDAWFNKGEYSKSIADYSRTIKLDQTSVLGWSRRCWVRAIYGQIPQALADCNKALSLSPDDSETLNSRGLVYLKMNDYAAAIVDYAAALVHDPESASSLFGRGLAELRKGDVAKGNADTAAAKVIQPNIAEEFKIYGLSEHKMGDRKTRQDNPKVAEKATWKTDEMAVVVLAHLERVKDYQELSALYAKRSTADVNWLRGDEGQAIDAQLKSWRKDAAAVSIIHGKIGRELQYSIGGMVVTDAGIAVADLEKSSAYRETIAEAIAQNIMTSPLDAKVMAALAAFRNEPAAHEAVSKGLQAAHEQNWQLAIDDFQTARKLTPDAPELLGYLGLAESKIPGRELRAIAWFGTYLAAKPQQHLTPDSNAAARRQPEFDCKCQHEKPCGGVDREREVATRGHCGCAREFPDCAKQRRSD